MPVFISEHLLLGQYFLGVGPEHFGLSFDAAIHTGAVLAVVSFFWRDVLRIARAFLHSLRRPDLSERGQRTAYLILLATGLVGIVGFSVNLVH